MTDTAKTPFTIIRGGLSDSSLSSTKEFVSASITDTRLMGVICLHVQWNLPENLTAKDFHQFFYFDCEEDGFDTYKSIVSTGDDEDVQEVNYTEASLMGGLGGRNIPITEREVRFLVQQYVKFNLNEGFSLPGDSKEYDFIMKPNVILNEDEEYVLMCKQCTQITSAYQALNYFIMRCVARDFSAAKFLTKHYVRTDLFPEHKCATLLRNSIEDPDDSAVGTGTIYHCTDSEDHFETFKTYKAYLCESLIEYDGKYFILLTQITLDHFQIVKYERLSFFSVTEAEVALMTAKPEFITVMDIIDEAPEFDKESTQLTSKAMVTEHESGNLYMIFYPHNDHVSKKIYKLNDDVLGIYYAVGNDQLIMAAYDLKHIKMLEKNITDSTYKKFLIPVSKYEFKEPVLYDFIHSGFEDFEDFVHEISGNDDDQ